MIQSAGLIMYRVHQDALEILLGHPGGPFYKNKDIWSIPKGEVIGDQDLLSTAIREFEEETGIRVPETEFVKLGYIVGSRKTIHAWGFEYDWDPGTDPFRSNMFELEWPPKSGRVQEFPEMDKIEFCPWDKAVKKVYPKQEELIEALHTILIKNGRIK